VFERFEATLSEPASAVLWFTRGRGTMDDAKIERSGRAKKRSVPRLKEPTRFDGIARRLVCFDPTRSQLDATGLSGASFGQAALALAKERQRFEATTGATGPSRLRERAACRQSTRETTALDHSH
jgi:hypothetical protein